MTQRDLTSSPVAAVSGTDRVRGAGERVVIEYGDYECPYCARTDLVLRRIQARVAFRHFPVTSKHPRARVLAHAAEAAALQDRFWEMHDSLYADQGRIDDPHLWERAERLGLDVDRFERDRRSDSVRARVDADFRAGVRAGVVTTPTLALDGRLISGLSTDELVRLLAAS